MPLPNGAQPAVIRVRLGLNLGPRVSLPVVEAYLARCDARWIVIDSGPPGSTPAILAAMRHHNIAREEVAFIVLTHGHFDHFGSALRLREALGAHVRIVMHPADRPFVTGTEAPHRLRPTSPAGSLPLLCGTFWMLLSRASGQLRPWTEAESAEALWLEDTHGEAPVDLREQLGLPLQALHTPGHSPGSVCLRLPTGELFTGDILSHTLIGSAPAWPLLADDPERILPSLQRIAALRPRTVYPGHGAAMPGEAVVALVRSLSEGRNG